MCIVRLLLGQCRDHTSRDKKKSADFVLTMQGLAGLTVQYCTKRPQNSEGNKSPGAVGESLTAQAAAPRPGTRSAGAQASPQLYSSTWNREHDPQNILHTVQSTYSTVLKI